MPCAENLMWGQNKDNMPSDGEEEPNKCDRCGYESFKYSVEVCEQIGDGYYCYECINCYNGWKEEEDKKNYRQIVKKSIIDWFGETILKPYARICKNDGTLQQFKEKMKKIIDEF